MVTNIKKTRVVRIFMNNRNLRLIFYLFLIFICFSLFYLYFSPFGKAYYSKDFSKNYNNIFLGRGSIYKLGPADRIIEKNKLISEPAYFYLKTARAFDNAKIKIKYRLSPNIATENNFINIEAGVLLDKNNWNYRLYPVYNSFLNKCIDSWHVSDYNGLKFFQNKEQFKNLESFLGGKDFSSLALYNYKLNNDFVLRDYKTSQDYRAELPKLRGSHSFYTYIKDQSLRFDFTFKNISNNFKDNIDLFVYLNQDVIFSKSFLPVEFGDNGVDFSLNLPDLPESVYKIEVKTSDDYVIDKLISYLPKVVFLNKINLYDNSDGFEFFSNSSNLRAKVLDASCLASIHLNDDIFNIDRIFKQFTLSFAKNKMDQELNFIKSSSCGTLFEGSALFSFNKESFFNPLILNLNEYNYKDNFEFIIADYNKPEFKDGYYISEVEMDLKNSWRENNEYRFIISAPFLDGNNEKYLEINSVEINLMGKGLKQKLIEYFKK